MRTKEEYIQGLKKMRRNVYYDGNLIDRDCEEHGPTLNVMGITFDAAHDPELQHLCTATSHISGETINRFNHVHQSAKDLHMKQDMTRILARKSGFCIQRCMGIDAVNALNAVSFEADKVNNGETQYHENFRKWLDTFQKNDLVAACAQTDVKGERLKRPSEQADPDMYLHVVEENSNGIVVRGCKNHISQASIADEILVLPTRQIMADEKEYAVGFAIPADAEGVKQVATIHNLREREIYKRRCDHGWADSYVIFDDVLVPWDRVFLNGENDHASIAALLFALFHRHSYSGCKPAVGDILLGLAALAAEVNGIEKAPHVKKILADIIKVGELGYAAGYTASALAKPEIVIPGLGDCPYGPGGYFPNSIYANVGRCLTGEAVFHEAEMLCDLAGGTPSTLPHEKDFANPEMKPLLEKYFKRNPKMDVEDQIKFWMTLAEKTCSSTGTIADYGAYHGGGSPIMEQIVITMQYNIEARKNMVRWMSGMAVDDNFTYHGDMDIEKYKEEGN